MQFRATVSGVALGQNRHGRADKITLTVNGLTADQLAEVSGYYGKTITLKVMDVAQRDLFEDDEGDESDEMTERFWIDEGSFPIHADEETGEYRLTGREIRELLDPPAESLYQWVEDPFNAGQHKRELVEDSALISLVDGDRFTTVAAEATNGQVAHDDEDDGDGELDLNAPTPIGARGRGAE